MGEGESKRGGGGSEPKLATCERKYSFLPSVPSSFLFLPSCLLYYFSPSFSLSFLHLPSFLLSSLLTVLAIFFSSRGTTAGCLHIATATTTTTPTNTLPNTTNTPQNSSTTTTTTDHFRPIDQGISTRRGPRHPYPSHSKLRSAYQQS